MDEDASLPSGLNQGLEVPGQSSKPKRSRTSTHKVRTGCINCKRRHVKCDETKPSCRNCLKFLGHCDGYEAPQRKRPQGPVQICWNSKATTPVTSISSRLHHNPDTRDILDDQGTLYFHEFVSVLQNSWTGAAFANDLWGIFMPQLSHSSRTLCHAAMAIGALSLWHRQSNHDSLRSAISPLQIPIIGRDSHYFHALAHHSKSLRGQRQQSSIQETIFLSVLLLFFETLQDNRKAALDHLNHGLNLMVFLVLGEGAGCISQLGPNPQPVLAAISDILRHLLLQARTILRASISDGPPLPNFTRGVQANGHTIDSFILQLSLLRQPAVSLGAVPHVFHSLDEFEIHLSTLQHKQIEMIWFMQEGIQQSNILYSTAEDSIGEFYYDILNNPHTMELSDALIRSTEALNSAFLPLFNQTIMSDTSSPSYMRALHLRLRSLAVQFMFCPANYFDIASLTAQTPLYREYLSAAGIAIAAIKKHGNGPAQQLSLQCEISLHLLIISLFCRDPLTRDEAVWMLKEYPGQDGLWNSRALSRLAERNRFIEQMNVLDGTPEEQWQRLWLREFVFENGGDRVILRYTAKDPVTGVWQRVEEAADIGGDSEQVEWKRREITGSGGLLLAELYRR